MHWLVTIVSLLPVVLYFVCTQVGPVSHQGCLTSQLPHSPSVSQLIAILQISLSSLLQWETNTFLCFSKLAVGKFFVKISLVISAPGFQMTCTIPASFISLKKNCF